MSHGVVYYIWLTCFTILLPFYLSVFHYSRERGRGTSKVITNFLDANNSLPPHSCTAWAIFVIAMEMWKIYQIEDIGRNLKGNTWVICVGYICCVGVVVEVTKYIEENGIEKGRRVYQILSNRTVGWDAIPMKF